MKCHVLIAAAALALAGCGQAGPSASSTADLPSVASSSARPAAATSTPATTASDTMARYDGYGDMRFGMDEATFDKAWGGELKGAPEPDSPCFYKTPKWVKSSGNLAFMFEAGHFVRYDVGTAKEAAPGGGRVGMDEARILALYGARVQAQPHFYVDGAKYLRIAAPRGDGVLLFETDEHGKVTRWRAGVPPQVDYVEGCS